VPSEGARKNYRLRRPPTWADSTIEDQRRSGSSFRGTASDDGGGVERRTAAQVDEELLRLGELGVAPVAVARRDEVDVGA
jgi:hypothetical protein